MIGRKALALLVASAGAVGAHAQQGPPACAQPADPESVFVNTGKRTCWQSSCDRIVGRTLYFLCFTEPAEGFTPSLCAHDMDSRETRVVHPGSGWLLEDATVLKVEEDDAGGDINEDGDLHDVFLYVAERPAGPFRLVGTLADRSAPGFFDMAVPVARSRLVAFSLPEFRALRDLNGDGDEKDIVVQLHALGVAGIVNTGIVGRVTEVRGPRVFVMTAENPSLGGIDEDLNGDGDRDDHVLRVIAPGASRPPVPTSPVPADVADLLDPANLRVWNTGLAGQSGSRPQVVGDLAYHTVREASQGRDLNGDGDRDDWVLHRLDLSLQTAESLSIAGQMVTPDPLAEHRLIVLEDRPGERVLTSWDPFTGDREDLGGFDWIEDRDGDRLLLAKGFPGTSLTVLDLTTRQPWFAGVIGHPGAARLSGGRVALHSDERACYGGRVASVVEYADYERGGWSTTGRGSGFFVRPQIAGPVISFSSNEYLAQEDLNGDGYVDWFTSVQTYVITPDWDGGRPGTTQD